MEKTIDRKIKKRFMIGTSELVCAGISLLLGYIALPIGAAFSLIYVSYAYLRSTKEACISIFFILLCSLSRGLLPAYFYALGFTVYFVLIHILKIQNQNLYSWLPRISAMITAVYSFQAYQLDRVVIILPIVVYIVMQQMFMDYTWIRDDVAIPAPLISIIVIAIALVIANIFPLYQEVVYMVVLLNVAYIADNKTSLALLIMMAFLIPIDHKALLLLAALMSVCKDQKFIGLLWIGGAFLLLPTTIEDYIYILISGIGLFIIPRQASQNTIDHEQFASDNVVKRQMNNYAGIFQLLAEYYTQINDVQAELLSNMASALQYNAEIIRKVQGNDKDKAYICRSLEGYQYEVRELAIDEPKEGCLQINMEIANIKRGEIRTTLLPLMEVLLHRKLEVEQIHSHRFINGIHQITFVDKIPFAIDAYADSIKNSYTSSGDTFSIFRFRQSVVCMISDGMGNGDRALRSSRLITSIFQRMMICGISQDQAIRCINKLVQSDTFATLDVLCFNKAQGVAYISKSAACPTFLLRDGKMYEINGNALPVGIISQMQPDCFQIEYKAGDEYLMVSDGVGVKEIYEWMAKRDGLLVKEDIEMFVKILRRTKRMDDSTVILAKVDEITS